ncbi:hypothetical protein HIM_05302 [Hirsutella minnesotensis 3608]|uniref:Uncharacterized protein n=1 Tax=Hirsutella minnesotensis 3608 TaxID=1043627 RepID=A0A0F7ZKL6_9HYPO|nr:hypothetical protein HIM_05302 [Hirsutella minnesotensis 3608]
MSDTSTARAISSSWRWEPIKSPLRASWHVDLPPSDVAKVAHGVVPLMMEDRWFCFAEDPDAEGVFRFHLCRSWTGNEIATLTIRAALDAAGTLDPAARATVTEIAWEEDASTQDRGEADAKETAADVCRGLMDCEFKVQ